MSGGAVGLSPQQRHRLLLARVRTVAALSVVWMGVDGAIGVAVGVAHHSIALLGYGLDNTIQASGALVLLWRFTGSRTESEVAERRAQQIVAASFLLFAPYLAIEALRRLHGGGPGAGSWVGVALAVVGVVLMPIFGRTKQGIGGELGSAVTCAGGTQNLLCAGMSVAIVCGFGAEALLGWRSLDPVVALVVASGAFHVGIRTWRGATRAEARAGPGPGRAGPGGQPARASAGAAASPTRR